MKISLKAEMETLLIPLYGRARMSQRGIVRDKDAEEAVSKIDFDFSSLRIREKTEVMLSVRAALIDGFTLEFLKEHPGSAVFYLGCGLDARAKRLSFPVKLWYDLDFPQVIDIKRQLYEETAFYRYIPSSVTDWAWLDGVDAGNAPVLVIAEGLFMYLSCEDVRKLFLKLRGHFGHATLIFDVYSKLTAKRAKSHPSLKKTGAVIRSGFDSPAELESFGPGIAHVKTMHLTDGNAVKPLPIHYRALFKLAGKFKSVREAHRIFVMALKKD